MLHLLTREGISGLEVVEVSPPYDVGDVTALLGARVVLDVLGTLVSAGKLGRHETTEEREARSADQARWDAVADDMPAIHAD
jgi:agmatinase